MNVQLHRGFIIRKIENLTGVSYAGYSIIGTATDVNGWAVVRLTESGSGKTLSWGEGSWDDRGNLDYATVEPDYFAQFFTSGNEFVNGYLYDSKSELSLIPTGRGCFYGDSDAGVQASVNIIDSSWSKWAYRFKVSAFVLDNQYSIFIGHTTNGPYISFRLGTTNNFYTKGFSSGIENNYDTSEIIDGDTLIFIMDGNETRVYVNDTHVETFGTFVGNLSVIGNYLHTTGFGANCQYSDVMSYDLSLHTGEFTPSGLPEQPTHHFPLDEYLPDANQTNATFYDVEGGATAELVNGTFPDSIGTTEGFSWGTMNGYAKITAEPFKKYPRLADGSGYAGLDGTELGFTEYPTINEGKGANGGNNYKFSTIPQELIDIDTDNVFQTGGVANEIDPTYSTSVPDNSYISNQRVEGKSNSKMEIG